LLIYLLADVCAAFAASFLIRIARLFPRELDLKKTAKDVEELASVLEKGMSRNTTNKIEDLQHALQFRPDVMLEVCD
jgi:hypothetical protein